MLVKFISRNYSNITQESLQMNKRIGIFFNINSLLLHSKMQGKIQAGNFSFKKKIIFSKCILLFIIYSFDLYFIQVEHCRDADVWDTTLFASFLLFVLYYFSTIFFLPLCPIVIVYMHFKWNKINVKIFSSYHRSVLCYFIILIFQTYWVSIMLYSVIPV